ncbi:MAG: tRNA pseudouridine(13) synthase TruD [Gammaproteobacteria bacterium]|nr:tRNA pseudouridine(13) synthase TruD [Gammaproteobacteria bacterium]MBU6508830.1 tRNA pseudouridine(13) synthase TruD [Gammaproteobacteria bacterium]MDE1983128.1 tRNA pseudouridine(13) synthase TruD [Gammaproteobacteria bacterium]MDE2108657.1 tRNA pseudouridine(13) synthase TruD [Gammaproteobacteria bacterium]MDE2460168.1 tRNA pseudouridine(13) synthase TruD [Gammaproteobacteria bacterium]
MGALPEWARAHSPVVAHGRLRASPEDFQVEEVLGFEADGAGEHLLVKVEKRSANTLWVARELARYAGIPPRDVSFAGIKDRHAVAIQHFSLWLGKHPEPDWQALANPEFRVLSAARHGRKLRTGALQGNRFELVLRELSAPPDELEPRLRIIREQGVPNYFGPQRFGRDGANIGAAEKMFMDPRSVRDRKLRGLLLSAARSLIFNAVLSRRVAEATWNTILPGEVCMLDGSHSIFQAACVDEALRARCASGDLHPTGPLWGRGESRVSGQVQVLETGIATEYAGLAHGLGAAGLEAARRSLRLPLHDLSWQSLDGDTLKLGFSLPAGAYATSVVRELIDTHDANQGDGNADEN